MVPSILSHDCFRAAGNPQQARKAQRQSSNQLEAKYALKYKLKKDKLDRRLARLQEREAKVVEVEKAMQASRQRVTAASAGPVLTWQITVGVCAVRL